MMRFSHEAVKARRKELGLSQAEVAEQLEITQGIFSLMERGCTDFSVLTLVDLAVALDLSINELFTEAE